VRRFRPPQEASTEKREVRQFQFMAWPDHGVPEHPTPLLLFMRRVKFMTPPDCGPTVVHCRSALLAVRCFKSAGIRSGVVLAIPEIYQHYCREINV